MDKIWANRLIAGDKAWSDVPEKRRDAVKQELSARVADGIINEERMSEIIRK